VHPPGRGEEGLGVVFLEFLGGGAVAPPLKKSQERKETSVAKKGKLVLETEVTKLGSAVERLAEAIAGPSGLTQKTEQYAAMVSIMTKKLQSVEEIVGRVVFPERAMQEMVGELRALRHLLDERGQFRSMDSERKKADEREREKAGRR
jgi:hypothetical protein